MEIKCYITGKLDLKMIDVGQTITSETALLHLMGITAKHIHAKFRRPFDEEDLVDLVHEVMLRLINSKRKNIVKFFKLEEFVVEKPFSELKRENEFRDDLTGQQLFQETIWKLLSMLDNMGKDFVKAKVGSDKIFTSIELSDESAIEGSSFAEVLATQVGGFIDELPEDQKKVINLTILGDKPSEIAAKTGLSATQVSHKLEKIREKIKYFM